MKAGVIVDVEATPAYRTDEVNSTKTMIERVEQRFDLNPARLIGDTAYGTAEMLHWMVDEKAIEPHVPVWEKSERNDGTFSRSDFEWHEQDDEYRCPGGKALRRDLRKFTVPRIGIALLGEHVSLTTAHIGPNSTVRNGSHVVRCRFPRASSTSTGADRPFADAQLECSNVAADGLLERTTFVGTRSLSRNLSLHWPDRSLNPHSHLL